jgi:tetratricopeptide (TPR) repeat protein
MPVMVEAVKPLVLAHEAALDGSASYKEKDYTMAIENFTKAIDLYKSQEAVATEADSVAYNIEVLTLNTAKVYSDIAFNSFKDQMYTEALQNFEKSLAIYKSIKPTTITQKDLTDMILDLYSNLALTSQQAKDYEKTISYYNKILEVTPNNEEVLNLKFSVLRDNIKDEARAMKVLKDYAEVSNDPNAYIMIADKYRDANNNTEAENYYLKALAQKNEASVMLKIADFYRSIGEWNKSTDMFMKFIATNPAQDMLATAYKLVGDNYRQAKNTAKMVEYFEKYIGIERDPQIALLLASHYNGIKNYNKVVTYSTIVLGSDSKNTDAIMLRGLAYYNLKRSAEAKADLEKIQNDSKYGDNAKKLLKALK